MSSDPIVLDTSPEYQEIYQEFEKSYCLQAIALAPETKQPFITPRKERKCRFCGKRWPEVSFNSEAHIIPESLGNRYLVSEYECDVCNHKFGKLDDQLCKFIGVTRSLNGTQAKGKTKKPDYKSADNKVTVRHRPIFNDESAISIELAQAGNGALSRGDSRASQTLKLVKSPYVPLMAYLALVKMSLCIIPENEIEAYREMIVFLNRYKRDSKITVSGAKAIGYYLPIGFGYEYPRILLFKKKHESELVPTHSILLYLKNMILQVWLPLNKNDLFNNGKTEISPPDCPPLFFGPYSEINVPIRKFQWDLSSNAIVKGEEEQLSWAFSDEVLKNLVSYNPTTKVFQDKQLDSSEIKQIILSHSNFTFDNLEGTGAGTQ